MSSEASGRKDPIAPLNSRRQELFAFLVLAVLIWPIIAVGVVGGYGFSVWMYQIVAGPPGPLGNDRGFAMEAPSNPTRRSFLTGRRQTVHISSAVVSVLPPRREDVARRLAAMDGVEVHHQSPSKIVIVLEGPESGVLGAKLAEIASIDGVLSANMVFEQSETVADLGEAT